jgi:predicted nucleotide-binding protein
MWSLQGKGTIPETSLPPHDRPDDHPPANEMPVHHVLGAQVKRGSVTTTLATAIVDDERRRRVFITHGKNRDLVEPIKKLLEYGELVPVVSVERQPVSKPVPEKVMGDMRVCGAAIIHVDAGKTIKDTSGDEHVLLNPNILIEIGAAMAFYGRRFILLVRDGVKLPSNLQGLYEVRYSGEILDANATIKLLEAIKDIKNHALPSDALINENE